MPGCGLYELCQRDATCERVPRCHHPVIPQCVAPTHSKKKNPCLRQEKQNNDIDIWNRQKDTNEWRLYLMIPVCKNCMRCAWGRFANQRKIWKIECIIKRTRIDTNWTNYGESIYKLLAMVLRCTMAILADCCFADDYCRVADVPMLYQTAARVGRV